MWTTRILWFFVPSTGYLLLRGAATKHQEDFDDRNDEENNPKHMPRLVPSKVPYTAFDDASWAVTSRNILSGLGENDSVLPTLGQQREIYQTFLHECEERDKRCRKEDDFRMYMNAQQPPCMRNYTTHGYTKVKTPPDLFALIREFFHNNRDRAVVELNKAGAYHNAWSVPPTILKTEDQQYIGGGWNLSAAIWNQARNLLEEWTGQQLAGSSVYGIRIYHNQSLLAPHVDRLPLVASAIINVDQDVEEDWVLEVYGHDGKATNVTMKPGDMVLYESHSVIHGRPFPLNGKFYANLFIHFEPVGPLISSTLVEEEEISPGHRHPDNETILLPPYLLPNSSWISEYLRDHPKGWPLLNDVAMLAVRGDLRTLRYVAHRDPHMLQDRTTEERCNILHNALNHLDLIKFLVLEMGYNINDPCHELGTLLDQASDPHLIDFLKAYGGLHYDELAYIEEEDKEQCELMHAAMGYGSLTVVDFVLERVKLNVNMICRLNNEKWATPLDYVFSLSDHPLRHLTSRYLKEKGAQRYEDLPDTFEVPKRRNLDPCFVLAGGLDVGGEILEFLLTDGRYNVNMVCRQGENAFTPLDLALGHFPNRFHPVISFLIEEGALTHKDLLASGRPEKPKVLAQASFGFRDEF